MVRDDSEDVAQSVEGYAEAPLPVIRNGGRWPRPKYRFSLVACARWETPYIVEWLTYHRSIGFEHVYLYCNDDDPTELYEKVMPLAVGNKPFVTFVHYSYVGLQFQIYFHFLRNYSPETEWLIFLDIDEFITIKNIDNIDYFLNDFSEEVEAIYFNWCSFGCNGYKDRPDGSVLTNYTRRENGGTPFTKILIKTSSIPYKELFWKQPFSIHHDINGLGKDIHSVNVLGDSMYAYYQNFPDRAWDFLNRANRRERIVQKAFIAHYNIKSKNDFEFRVKRSLKGPFSCQVLWGDMSKDERERFFDSTNAVEDLYLHDYWIKLCKSGRENSVFPDSAWPCLSHGQKVTQSSTAHNCSVEEDAQKLISGEFWGRSQAHTELEDNPWWGIDFCEVVRIHEIRIFNRLDGCLERVRHFRIDSSVDGTVWEEKFVKSDDQLYGGADGTPFIWRDMIGFSARYVRITLLAKSEYLSFDQIEFYGTNAQRTGS